MTKSNKGFSLVEILVVVSIVGFASLALMDVMRGFSISSAEAERKAEIQSLSGAIQMSLSNGADCLADLHDNTKTTMTLDTAAAATTTGQPLSITLKNTAGTILAENQTVTMFPKVIPSQIRLKDLKPVPGSANTYTANIYVTAIPATADKTMSQYHERDVMAVFLTTDASNKLQSCYSTGGSDFNGFCNSMNGNWDAAALKCTIPPAKECQDLGGSWDGANCVMSPAKSCASLGGSFDSTGCHIAWNCSPANGGQTTGSYTQPGSGSSTNFWSCINGTWVITANVPKATSGGSTTPGRTGGSDGAGRDGSDGSDGSDGGG